MTAREQAAGTPRTMSARMERQIRELLVEQMSQGDTFAALMNMLSLEVDAERALSAELAERAEASEANAERLAAALEGLVRWAFGDKNMPAVMARESHPEHGETCALCIARAALAKARGEREV